MIQSLVTEARRSPDLPAVLTERFINSRREAGAQIVRRAVDRGEVRPEQRSRTRPGHYRGPLYLRGVILGQEFPPDYSERLTDAVLRALGAK